MVARTDQATLSAGQREVAVANRTDEHASSVADGVAGGDGDILSRRYTLGLHDTL
jgi:hypothetical protein